MNCKKCGTCCRKGPPALHLPDISLYKQGHLLKGHLLTLRKGELVWDNVREQLVCLSEEMVRLRSCEDGSCIFFNHKDNLCTNYKFRPRECHVLTCWNPRPLEEMYSRNRVCRLDLIPKTSALGAIVLEHEQLCPAGRILSLVDEVRKRPANERSKPLKQLFSLLVIDQEMRGFLGQQSGARDDELNFIFGRPVRVLLQSMGVDFSEQEDRIIIRDYRS